MNPNQTCCPCVRRVVRVALGCLIAAAPLLAVSCERVQAGGQIAKLQGTGASLPDLVYQRWFADFSEANNDVRVSYQASGSSTGVREFIGGKVDFGASDTAMTEEEMEQVERGVQLLPMTGAAVVVVYHLESVGAGLKLPRDVLADIFLERIGKWNDPRIAAANPGVTLPDARIFTIHRAEGSGTTKTFTNHLSAVSDAWREQVGAGKSVEWPGGSGASKNAGVAANVKSTPGSIGYIDFADARKEKLAMARLQNKDGQFVAPATEAFTAGLAGIQFDAHLVGFDADPAGADAYPIVTYTWLLAYRHYSKDKGQALKRLLNYCFTKGQQEAEAVGYVPLPEAVVAKAKAAVDNIKIDG